MVTGVIMAQCEEEETCSPHGWQEAKTERVAETLKSPSVRPHLPKAPHLLKAPQVGHSFTVWALGGTFQSQATAALPKALGVLVIPGE